jgi:hypothetical protein
MRGNLRENIYDIKPAENVRNGGSFIARKNFLRNYPGEGESHRTEQPGKF